MISIYSVSHIDLIDTGWINSKHKKDCYVILILILYNYYNISNAIENMMVLNWLKNDALTESSNGFIFI
jgi:hypothetical protein